MPRPALRRRGRRAGGPTDRDWERSLLLEPRLAPPHPEFVSDGVGLPFAPSALDQPGGGLDPGDPAVDTLIALINRSASNEASATEPTAPAGLEGWRLLAQADGEMLFGRGRPPRLLTVAVRRHARRGTWKAVEVGKARPLRATRDGIRASGWRLDPTSEPAPDDTVLRLLVTEQTWAGGKWADDRLLPPDLYVGADDLVLTMFVTPQPGFQVRSPNPETPARVALPHPLGSRQLIDGALYDSP